MWQRPQKGGTKMKLTEEVIIRILKNPYIEEEIHDPRLATLDCNENIIIQSANPGMIKDNKNNDYTVIPLFI